MGVRLMVEVLDHSPDDLGAAERLLLIALAEKASDETREVLWPRGCKPRDVLMRRLGVSPGGLTKVFGRLAERDLDPRVPVAVDKRGKPVFAFEGTTTRYRLPVLRGDLFGDPLEPERVPEWVASEGAQTGALGDPNGDPLEPERVPEWGPLVPPPLGSPSRTSAVDVPAAHRSAVLQLLMLGGEITEHVAAAAVAAVVASKHPDNPAAYVSRFTAEDVQRWAGKAATRPAPLAPSGPRCTICNFTEAECTRRAATNEHPYTPPVLAAGTPTPRPEAPRPRVLTAGLAEAAAS